MGNQNARTHGFYSSRVTENEQDSFLHAIRLNGLQGEIALLRLRIRRIVANPDAPPDCFSKPSTPLFAPWNSMSASTKSVARHTLLNHPTPSANLFPLDGGRHRWGCTFPMEGESDSFPIFLIFWAPFSLEVLYIMLKQIPFSGTKQLRRCTLFSCLTCHFTTYQNRLMSSRSGALCGLRGAAAKRLSASICTDSPEPLRRSEEEAAQPRLRPPQSADAHTANTNTKTALRFTKPASPSKVVKISTPSTVCDR